MAEEKKTGIDVTEAGFEAVPDDSPIEQIEADSFIASEAELQAEMKEAGIKVPEKETKEPVIPEGAINQEEKFFAEMPEMSPLEQLGADEPVASAAEINEDMKKAGLL